MPFDAQAAYVRLKAGPTRYNEELHCPMLLKNLASSNKGTVSAFCVEAFIGENTFYNWLKKHPLFMDSYMLGKMLARENWEEDGRQIRNIQVPIGTVSHEFEYWRMIGWSRFGVGKNSRIRLDLDPTSSPNEHYSQLLAQAASGDFTAGEIKQLMEAVNVGLNAHQVFTLQKQIDELKSDVLKMDENRSVQNTFTNQATAQKD